MVTVIVYHLNEKNEDNCDERVRNRRLSIQWRPGSKPDVREMILAVIKGEDQDLSYDKVAEVAVPDDYAIDFTDNLEYAFDRTNHIDKSWTENAGVTTTGDGPFRSTSVGDIMQAGLRRFIVDAIGFVEF